MSNTAEVIARVEARLSKYIFKCLSVCQFCGPTDCDGYTRSDGVFLCENCLQRATRGDITIS